EDWMEPVYDPGDTEEVLASPVFVQCGVGTGHAGDDDQEGAKQAQAPRQSARKASGADEDENRRDIGEIDPAVARPGRETPEKPQPEGTEQRQTATADRLPDQREHHNIEQRAVNAVAQD